MKKCGKCKEIKEFALFSKDKQTKTGYCNRCKLCDRACKTTQEYNKQRRLKRLERRKEINEYQREYQKTHRAQFNRYMKKYADKNRQSMRDRNNKFSSSEKQKPINNARAARRRAAKLKRTPSWLTREQLFEIQVFYTEAQRLTKETGELYTVDHIEPLQGENVSGLHVPWNLQVLKGLGPNGNFAVKNKRKQPLQSYTIR